VIKKKKSVENNETKGWNEISKECIRIIPLRGYSHGKILYINK
jgi:hypothetical protein